MDQLIKQGWVHFHTCNCRGGRKGYYKNEAFKGYEIRVNMARQTFTIINNNLIVAGPAWLYQLETKMKENAIWKD